MREEVRDEIAKAASGIGSSAYRAAYEDDMNRVEHQGPTDTEFEQQLTDVSTIQIRHQLLGPSWPGGRESGSIDFGVSPIPSQGRSLLSSTPGHRSEYSRYSSAYDEAPLGGILRGQNVVSTLNGHKGAASLLLGRSWETADELLSELAASKLSDMERRLFQAAVSGGVDTVRVLTQFGVDLAYPEWGATALLEVIAQGQVQAAKLLIESGASKRELHELEARATAARPVQSELMANFETNADAYHRIVGLVFFPGCWPSRPEQWEKSKPGSNWGHMPALVGPMQSYAQLGHPGALPPKDQSAGIPEACLWGLSLALSGGTLGAQWAKTPPGSHGAIAWHLPLHGGNPVINLGIPERPRNPWTFCRLASIG
ncbi:hypothetical protein CHGG_00356 [Chaetomium globosum CBS 148.51]|uniref:Uncharacterized protein n=1 Tax=Chaetomium globosum (strain ATCC 6205 / CBS 148.51 / DSM 1962 / NBRC 6347 / NRRL 1970) TaxID=306901 RepID=Q2HHE8_CHAGB|nr:uncharacterized protein CHGG_00356 [Chaetomium globosum CBS 148.51]EAQ92121.1 hypothetical protein CHGG_00356 [Chaetomium globosum CBS 148.51]